MSPYPDYIVDTCSDCDIFVGVGDLTAHKGESHSVHLVAEIDCCPALDLLVANHYLGAFRRYREFHDSVCKV